MDLSLSSSLAPLFETCWVPPFISPLLDASLSFTLESMYGMLRSKSKGNIEKFVCTEHFKKIILKT